MNPDDGSDERRRLHKRQKTNGNDTPGDTAENCQRSELNRLSKQKLVDTVICQRENIDQLESRITMLRQIIDRKYESQRNDFPLLPDEIILKIFAMLPALTLNNLARICRHWRGLVADGSLWNRKKVDLARKTLKPGCPGSVLSRGTRELDLSAAKVKSPVVFGIRSESFHVQRLDLSDAKISEADLVSLLGRCGRLQSLSLENAKLSYGIGQVVGERLPDLKSLSLARCKEVCEAITLILQGCTVLAKLNLAQTSLEERYGYKNFVEGLPSTMTALGMPSSYQLNDASLDAIVLRCPNLTLLDLAYSSRLTAAALASICRLTALENLGLSSTSIPASALGTLQVLSSLKILHVGGIVKPENVEELEELKLELPALRIDSYSTRLRFEW